VAHIDFRSRHSESPHDVKSLLVKSNERLRELVCQYTSFSSHTTQFPVLHTLELTESAIFDIRPLVLSFPRLRILNLGIFHELLANHPTSTVMVDIRNANVTFQTEHNRWTVLDRLSGGAAQLYLLGISCPVGLLYLSYLVDAHAAAFIPYLLKDNRPSRIFLPLGSISTAHMFRILSHAEGLSHIYMLISLSSFRGGVESTLESLPEQLQSLRSLTHFVLSWDEPSARSGTSALHQVDIARIARRTMQAVPSLLLLGIHGERRSNFYLSRDQVDEHNFEVTEYGSIDVFKVIMIQGMMLAPARV